MNLDEAWAAVEQKILASCEHVYPDRDLSIIHYHGERRLHFKGRLLSNCTLWQKIEAYYYLKKLKENIKKTDEGIKTHVPKIIELLQEELKDG